MKFLFEYEEGKRIFVNSVGGSGGSSAYLLSDGHELEEDKLTMTIQRRKTGDF